MAKRGRKKKFKLNLNLRPETVRTVFALGVFLFAGLSLISFFAPNYTINSKIYNLLTGTFGWVSILVPILCFQIGLLFFEKIKLKIKEPRIVAGLFSLMVGLSSLTAVINKSEDSGGFVGQKLSGLISSLISKVGAGIAFIVLITLSVVIILNVSFDEIIEYVRGIFKSRKTEKKHQDGNESESKDDIEITASQQMISESHSPENKISEGHDEKRDFEEVTYEILPAPAEPKSGSMMSGTTTISSSIVEPSLPYANKVWELPPLSLLATPTNLVPDIGDRDAKAKIIRDTLRSFGIDSQIENIQAGPTVTQYALKTKSGTKVSKVANLSNDLALALASPNGTVRIEAPIPGKALIGIEVPNNKQETVYFKSLITCDQMKSLKSKLGIVLGMDVGGQPHVYDISRMPHLLIAGTTGSGKSIFIHNVLFSIFYRASPQEVKLILVDPKRVELNKYTDMPHLLAPVVTDMDKAPSIFRWAVAEMERRYKLLDQAKVRNIFEYNEKSGFVAMPYILIVVDELADIMMKDPTTVEKNIIRIAQLARAVGIHLILAVQRPSTNIITGSIKANIPTRIAFNTPSQIDSRVIIDQPGAEKLLGRGDMLFIPPDAPKPLRLQGAYISGEEIDALANYLKNQDVPPDYVENILDMPSDNLGAQGYSSDGGDTDELYGRAVEIVTLSGKAAASMLQRKLRIGYARAARLIDIMEERGIVGPSQGGSRPRDVLISGGTGSFGSAYDPSEDIIAPDDPIKSLK